MAEALLVKDKGQNHTEWKEVPNDFAGYQREEV